MWIRPEKINFEGKWVRLEILNPELPYSDLYEIVLQSAKEPQDIFQYMPLGPFHTKNEFQEWLKKGSQVKDANAYCVFSKRLNQYVGMCSIICIVEEHGRAELGCIWYGKMAQRTEINTESMFLLLQYLFETLKYRRVEWKCDSQNIPSNKAALRLGFKYEGLFRNHMLIKGRNRDTAWYSIIDTEWQTVKEYFLKNLLREFK